MVSIKEDLNVTRPFSVYIGPVSRGAGGSQVRTGLGLLKSKPEYRRVLAGIAQICYFHFPDIFLRRRVECERVGITSVTCPNAMDLFITHHYKLFQGIVLLIGFGREENRNIFGAASRNNCGLKYQNM